MSTSFEIFPTKKVIPSCDEIIKYSIRLFSEFLKKENISQKITILTREIKSDNKVCNNPISLVFNENCHMVFELNMVGEVYVFYHELTELDKEFWIDEIQKNKNAQSMKEKIEANLEIGCSWSVKRTMSQPAIVSLYYGYLALAIATFTDGIVYSDDGAWDYSRLPADGRGFEKEYLNIENVSDITTKNNVKKWLDELKEFSTLSVNQD